MDARGNARCGESDGERPEQAEQIDPPIALAGVSPLSHFSDRRAAATLPCGQDLLFNRLPLGVGHFDVVVPYDARLGDMGSKKLRADGSISARKKHDARVIAAAECAAARIAARPGNSFVEKKIEEAMKPALEASYGGAKRVLCNKHFPIPNWKYKAPAGIGVDLTTLDGFGNMEVAIEVKAERLDFALYDIFKLSNLYTGSVLQAAYLAYAATLTQWVIRQGRLFTERGRQSHGSAELVWRFKEDWDGTFKPGEPRPAEVPERVELEPLATFDLPGAPGYELKVLAVREPTTSRTVQFDDDGWPCAPRTER